MCGLKNIVVLFGCTYTIVISHLPDLDTVGHITNITQMLCYYYFLMN